jgi:heme/copper-type cytochrome/quinol oxidase subunit 4
LESRLASDAPVRWLQFVGFAFSVGVIVLGVAVVASNEDLFWWAAIASLSAWAVLVLQLIIYWARTDS